MVPAVEDEQVEVWKPVAVPITAACERRQTIVSLLPSATEVLFAVGAGGDVVGTTHECQPLSEGRVECTANLLRPGLSAAEIDSAVVESLDTEKAIYRLDVEAVRRLEPTLIVTQALCAVCAVPESQVKAVACTMPKGCRVVSADPHTLEELFDSVQAVADAADRATQGQALVRGMRSRLAATREVARVTCGAQPKPRVMVLEWPDPPYAPGHWVWEMVDAAGGECVLGEKGVPSRRATWDELHAARPDVVVAAFCGYELADNCREVDAVAARPEWRRLVEGGARIFASNASAYFSRPGPRLVDGTELLCYMLHGGAAAARYKPAAGCGAELRDGKWHDLST